MKFAAFFGKLWLKTQSATKKVWALVKLHKVVSIASAATVVVAGTTCAIALPIALHNHEYSSEWTSDTKSHWHEAVCNHEDEKSDVAEHTYVNSCDADCDVCGKMRSASHTYDNVCDTVCNVCGETRDVDAHVFFNICDTDCNVCGATREVGAHVYDNDCDTVCNACGDEREITHTFDNACDEECNVCDYTRKTAHNHMLAMGDDTQHWFECTECGDAVRASVHRYDNACDTTCNDCGRERTIEHAYANEPYRNADKHWYECTVCGVKKDEADHEYTDACDTSCNVCQATRDVPEHVYDNDCDTTCNVCDAVRFIEHAYELLSDDNTHWYECSVCHVTKDELAHIYDHSCDTTCNVCNYTREVEDHPYKDAHTYDSNVHWYECSVCKQRKDIAPHVYTNACDTTCNDCGALRQVGPHIYDNNCDTACNICDAVRTVEPHPYSTAYTTDDANHWFVCEECGDITGVAPHEYNNACDTTCNVCDKTRDVPEHVYDNKCDKTCNVCDAVREVPSHPYSSTHTTDAANHWFVCEECGDITGVAAHTYDNDCDKACNVCEFTREVEPHIYDNACDTTCNECGDTREVPAHVYDNACDTACNVCGDVRTIEHDYRLTWNSDNHWNECFVCHVKKDVESHDFDNACDTACNVCDCTREVGPHIYDNACDDTCNECGDTREVDPHQYDNACDTTCNACGDVRVTTHVFDLCDDTECNECGAVREAEEHEYSGGCDDTCEKCPYERDVLPHEYDTEYTTDATGHWYQCTGCDSRKDESAHDEGKDKDDWYHWSKCSVCGYEKDDVVEHTYSEELTSEDGAEKHWKECTGCDSRIEEEEHHWNTVFDKDENSHWYECIDCGHKKDVEGHDYPADYEIGTDSHWKDCKVCGYRDEQSHDYPDEFTTDKSSHWKNCKVCAYSDKADHQNVWTYDESEHWYECEVCDKKSEISTHNFRMEIEDDEYLKSPATETDEAVYFKVCADCYKHNESVKGGETDVWVKAKNTPTFTIHVNNKEYKGEPLTFEYNGKPLTFNVTGYRGTVTITYKPDGADDFVPYTGGVIIDAGTYSIRVKTSETPEYYEGELIVEVTISKAVINLTWTIPDSTYDGTDKTASVAIESGVVGSDDVRVIAQLISGNPTKQNQTILYKATLSGEDTKNYVLNEEQISVTYTIDPCAHIEKDSIGFCTLCNFYTGVTQSIGKSVLFKDIDPSTEVIYCRFYQSVSNYKNMEIEYYLDEYQIPDYEYDFDDYRVYTGDEDGTGAEEITDDLAPWANAFLTLGDQYIYFVIRLDGSITQFAFTIQYYVWS